MISPQSPPLAVYFPLGKVLANPVMSLISPKPLKEYPFYLRWFFRRQARKYGRTLSPSWLWGRFPAHFGGLVFLLVMFQRKKFPVDPALRSLVSARVAQLNGCAFCVDLNAYQLFQATGSIAKAEAVARWRESGLYSERERVSLDYAEAMTDTARRVTAVQIGALKCHFDDDGVVALTAWIAFQNLSAKFNSALGAEENGLCHLTGQSTEIDSLPRHPSN
jgi:AhpD family alkylhydroperoxidase